MFDRTPPRNPFSFLFKDTFKDSVGAFGGAHRDFVGGILSFKTWASLGLYDVRLRYKRTLLGPLWITIGTAVTFTTMAMLFSAVLKQDIRHFLPYLGAGMIIWSLISGIVTEGPSIFIQYHHIIDTIKMPLTIHPLRCMFRNLLIFSHNLVAFFIVVAFVDHLPGASALLLLITLPILCIALFSAALILAMIGSRFRDVGQMIGVVMQLLFFLTPIIWSPSDIPNGRKYWVVGNPFHHLLEIVRQPLLGEIPSTLSLTVATATSITLTLIAYATFAVMRRRISYWL